MEGMRNFGVFCLVSSVVIASAMERVDIYHAFQKVDRFLHQDVEFTTQGHAISCGDPASHFNLTWDPKDIDPEQSVSFHFQMIATVGFSLGKVKVDVYIPSEKYPLYSTVLPATCAEAKKTDPKMQCPIKKGDKFDFSYTRANLSVLPPGKFSVVANVTNSHGEVFICFNMTAKVE